MRPSQRKFSRPIPPPRMTPRETAQLRNQRLARKKRTRIWALRFSMEISFWASCCPADRGRLLFSLSFVNLFCQGSKAAERCGNTQNQENDGKPRFGLEVSVQIISDRQPDGHGETHLQAEGAVARKLTVEPPILIFSH